MSGEDPINVQIGGLGKEEAKALWTEHLEPKVRARHAAARIKISDP